MVTEHFSNNKFNQCKVNIKYSVNENLNLKIWDPPKVPTKNHRFIDAHNKACVSKVLLDYRLRCTTRMAGSLQIWIVLLASLLCWHFGQNLADIKNATETCHWWLPQCLIHCSHSDFILKLAVRWNRTMGWKFKILTICHLLTFSQVL